MTKRTGDGVDKTLRNLFHKKETPKSAFVLLLLIYALSAVLTTMSSRIRGQVVLFDIPFEYSSLTGVFSLFSEPPTRPNSHAPTGIEARNSGR